MKTPSHLAIVARDVGGLQVLVGALMAAPLLVSLLYQEFYTALAFLISGLLVAGGGGLIYHRLRGAPEPREAHAMVIAASGWLATALLGALPFYLAAHLTPESVAQAFVPGGESYRSSLFNFQNPLHALFESMSAYTTTGLTMSVREPSIGHGLLFYRSLAQWIGGAGVIVLSLAILRRPSGVSRIALYQSEAAGVKLRPSVLGTARAIWKTYIGLTGGVALYLALGTFVLVPEYGVIPTLFDAVNHAMAAVSTGGFSTLDDSIAGYGSRAMELLHTPPMLLGLVSLPIFYQVLRRREAGILWRDAQVRTGLLLVAFGVPILVLLLLGDRAVAAPIGEGWFQFVSALSTTGWQTSDIGDWRSSAVLFLVGSAMIVGGAAGATVGGIKLIRAYLIAHAVHWRIARIFLPRNTVLAVPLGGRSLSSEEMSDELAEAGSFTLIYLALIGLSVIVSRAVLGPEFTLSDVIFESTSAQSTVGLSAGVTSPDMPVSVEILYVAQMWIGRLEIFPVLVFVRALFLGMRRRPSTG